MKTGFFWRSFLFWATLLVAAILLMGVWNAFAASSPQGEMTAVPTTEGTPTIITSTPTPLLPQSADTGVLVVLAVGLLVVILAGMLVGWRLTAGGTKALKL